MECLAAELEDRNIGVSILYPGPTRSNLGQSTFENRPENLKNDTLPSQQSPGGQKSQLMIEREKYFMDPLETGERVLRGIKQNDLFIHTHTEFTEGYISRHNAIVRAVPDEPRNEKRWLVVKSIGATYTDRYDKQQKVGPLHH